MVCIGGVRFGLEGQKTTDEDVLTLFFCSMGPERYCGRTVVITHKGRTIMAKAADTCPECDHPHLDLSRGAFAALANDDFSLGELDISWHIE